MKGRTFVFLTVLGLAISSGAGLPTIVVASAPDQMVIHVNRTTVLGVCGFPILRHDLGNVRFQDHDDQDGNFVFENAIATRYTITFTNPDNGKSLTSRRAYNERFLQYDDGTFKVVSVGLVANLVVPGEGLVAANVGNITSTFDEFGELLDIQITGDARRSDRPLRLSVPAVGRARHFVRFSLPILDDNMPSWSRRTSTPCGAWNWRSRSPSRPLASRSR